MTEHIVSSYDEELQKLSVMISRMGGHSEKLLTDAIAALNRRDEVLAMKTIAADDQIDRLEREVEDLAILMIAKRQPMALDLREIMAAIKISSDLERIGDLAKNIAKRTLILNQAEPIQLTRSVERMGKIAAEHLKQVLDAYANKDLQAAINVWNSDDNIDAHYNSLFRELLTYMIEDPRTISSCAHLLFIAKNLERIGDHGTNIAEYIHFLVTGEEIATQRPRADAVTSD